MQKSTVRIFIFITFTLSTPLFASFPGSAERQLRFPTAASQSIPQYTSELYAAKIAGANRRPDLFQDHHFLIPFSLDLEKPQLEDAVIPSDIQGEPSYRVFNALIGKKTAENPGATLLVCPYENHNIQASDSPRGEPVMRAYLAAHYLSAAFKKPTDIIFCGREKHDLRQSEEYYAKIPMFFAAFITTMKHNRHFDSTFVFAHDEDCHFITEAGYALAKQNQPIDTAVFINSAGYLGRDLVSPIKTLYSINALQQEVEDRQYTQYHTDAPNQRVHTINLTHHDDAQAAPVALEDNPNFKANNLLALMMEIDTFYPQFQNIHAHTYTSDDSILRNRFPIVWPDVPVGAQIAPELVSYIQTRQELLNYYNAQS